MPECVQQKNRQQESLRSQMRKSWEDINPGGNPENKRTEQKIDSENVHCLLVDTSRAIMAPRSSERKWSVLARRGRAIRWNIRAIPLGARDGVCAI